MNYLHKLWRKLKRWYRRPRGDDRTYCFGCETIIPYANSRCPCDYAREAKWSALEKEHLPDPLYPDDNLRLGFMCYEEVAPMRGLLKAIKRMKFNG